MRRVKLWPAVLLALVLILVSIITTAPTVRAQSSNPDFSTLYISPVTTCCSTTNTPYPPNSKFSVSVDLNLLPGESFSSFDVRINYTNFRYQTVQQVFPGVLEAMNVDYSHGIFSSSSSFSVLTECIDGAWVGGSGTGAPQGCSTDNVGQAHLSGLLVGANNNITGPMTGELFRINFNVTGTGSSVFSPDRVQLLTSKSLSLIPVVSEAGVFGNRGPVAFFNYQPDFTQDNLFSPSVLVNQPVSFDASASYVSNGSSTINSYSWNFGDSTTANVASPVHTFSQPGNYTVVLTVTDTRGESANLTRIVFVSPALGKLLLTVNDQAGNPTNLNVQVGIFNSSSSQTSISTKTVNQAGVVSFGNLTSGNYYLTFSGQGFVSSSKVEKIIPGFTVVDTIFLTIVPSPANYVGLIYLGGLAAGVAILAGALVYQKRKSNRISGRKVQPSAKVKNLK